MYKRQVQTHSGKWLAIDGRVLFKAAVTASETYNTAIEKHLKSRLGLTFTEREGSNRGKRPIREVVGVDPRLNERWSTRRASIQARRSELAAAFHISSIPTLMVFKGCGGPHLVNGGAGN